MHEMSLWNLNELEKISDTKPRRFRCVPTGAEYDVHWVPLKNHYGGGEHFPVKPDKNINSRPVLFIDLETTGDNPVFHDIIEIAMIRTDREEEYVQKCAVVNPSSWLAVAREKTGYNDKDWEDAPTFAMVAGEVFEWLATGGPAVVGHNLYRFDWLFLEWRLKSLGYPAHQVGRPLIDTMGLAFGAMRGHVPEDAGLSLNSCCKFLGVEPEGTIHRAVEGARRVQAIYERLTA